MGLNAEVVCGIFLCLLQTEASGALSILESEMQEIITSVQSS